MLKLRGIDVLIFIVVTLVLGGAAWGIGWMAHGLFDQQSAPPADTVEPTAPSPTAANSPTPPPAVSPPATPTRPPDSAPVPATSTAAPTAEQKVEMLIVESTDRGVYDVVRRSCGLPKEYVLTLTDEIVRETWQLNGFSEKSPPIFEGQEILIPTYLCP